MSKQNSPIVRALLTLTFPALLTAATAVSKLPLYFEPNRGQTDPSVSYLANIGDTRLFITRDAIVFAPSGRAPIIRMRTLNALRTAKDQPIERLPGVSNYLIGKDASHWITGVPQFAKLKRANVYPGIDLLFYGNQRQLEYDFVLAPGADPNRIELAYDGVDSIRTNPAGDLVLATSAGDFIQKKPKVYQQFNGKQVEIAANYKIHTGKTVSFELARYDHAKPLVIDPVIVFNAIVGSSAADTAAGVAIDGSLNTYVTGTTIAVDFPLSSAFQSTFQGTQKIFVFKLNPTGTALLYSTYLGGEGNETGQGIAVDSNGNAIVTGTTTSFQYPVVAAAQGNLAGQTDAVVSKLSASGGALLYSTYLGGTGNDQSLGIAVDPFGNAYVAGFSNGAFPVTAGALQTLIAGSNDCTVTKYNSLGAVLYSTYLGGGSNDACTAIAADPSGNAYVTGYTTSLDFPRTNGAAQTVYGGNQDAFVTEINPLGSALVYSTLYGAEGPDTGWAIAVDSQGAAYITGSTQSIGLPIISGFQGVNQSFSAAFIAKVAPLGGSFRYSTYLAGRKSDTGYGIAVDAFGNAYVVGSTSSDNFPLANPVIGTKPGASGVILKSTNGGISFLAADNGIPSTGGTSIVANPYSKLVLTVANGTLYNSPDFGVTWVNSNLGTIAGLTYAPNAPAIMYAYSAINSIIWQSFDGGLSWNSKVPTPAFTISSLAVSPTDQTFLMASSSGGSSSGIWTSRDSGRTWSAASGIAANIPMASVTFIGDSSDAVACSAQVAAGVYRATSGSATFGISNSGIAPSSFCTRVITDPSNPGILYVTASDGLYKSTDGGSHWRLLTNLAAAYPVVAVAVQNSSVLVAGSVNGGIYRSADGGLTWAASPDLSLTPVNAIAISPTDTNTVYAAVDISGEVTGFASVVNSVGNSLTFSTFLGGPGGTSKQYAKAVALDSAGNAYIVGQTASPFFKNSGGALNAGYGGGDIFVTKLATSSSACALSFGNSTLNPYATGGSFPVEVFAPAGCFWTATPGAAWVTISGVGSATGTAATAILVAANFGGARSTTVGFSTGQSITINQAPNGCGYFFSPNIAAVPVSGGSGSAPLSTSSGCTWNAVSSEPWLTLSNNSGTTAGSINYTATANPNLAARSAVITVATSTFTITEASATGPSYAGYVDSSNCSGFSGWAADKNRLNTSIVVSLFDGTMLLSQTIANGSRGDVGALLGDNGLHAFSLPFPAGYSNGVPHSFQLRFETSSTQLPGSPVTVTCGTAGGTTYTGYIDRFGCSGISGWAADKNRLNVPIIVTLWDGGTPIASTLANGLRGDVGAVLGDNGLHGFGIQIPSSYLNGVSHSLQVTYETSPVQLPGSPVTFTCGVTGGVNYTGYIDNAGCNGISGWAADKNRPSVPILVSLYDGALLLSQTLANGSRSDVGAVLGDNGLHGFSLPIPSGYANGVSHTLQLVYETSSTRLPGAPLTFTCGTIGGLLNYVGYVDSSSCTGISGWAADKNRLNVPIVVSLWDGGTQIASTTASGSRGDVGSLLGDNGLHGFFIPIPAGTANGATHSLQIRYETSASQLTGSPVVLTCGASGGVSYTGYVDSASCSGINGWAADKNRLNTSILVTLWDGAIQIASTTANGLRGDVGSLLGDNGLHGFSMPLPPAYVDGAAHTLQIRYETSSAQLPGSPATFQCGSPAGSNFTGFVDSLSCSALAGWAADKSALNSSITVQFFDGTTLLGNTIANILRADVGTLLGDNGMHGFIVGVPPALKDGNSHNVTFRAVGSAVVFPGVQSLSGCR